MRAIALFSVILICNRSEILFYSGVEQVAVPLEVQIGRGEEAYCARLVCMLVDCGGTYEVIKWDGCRLLRYDCKGGSITASEPVVRECVQCAPAYRLLATKYVSIGGPIGERVVGAPFVFGPLTFK